MTRFTIASAALGLILTATAAQAVDKCGPISLIAQIQMVRIEGSNLDFVPFTLDGDYTQFMLDTGGSMTQIEESAARDLKLIIQPGNIRMYDMRGQISNSMTLVQNFSMGDMHGTHGMFPVTPNHNAVRTDPWAGILALDYLRRNDVDMDFGTDKLNIIAPDHCPGHVPFTSEPVAVVPFTKSQDEQQIVVKVTLDGQELTALIDTGATQTFMRNDIAESKYNLTLGAADTPENRGGLNGDAALKTYRHVFGAMSFGDIAVTNPHITIFPNAMGNVNDRWGRTTKLAETDIVNAPQLVIGMDVLRKLRLFMSFSEGKLYVTPASPPAAAPSAASASSPNALQASYKKNTLVLIASMTQQLPDKAKLSGFLNNLCFLRATVKADLEAASDLCKRANAIQPRNEHIMDNVAFVLYQQGNYKDALAAYDANLALHPKHADSLFMRGFTKGKLGDQAGKGADIAAARAIDPGITSEFSQYDIDF
jgi:tetratricopeptide (TPR) repeat protein